MENNQGDISKSIISFTWQTNIQGDLCPDSGIILYMCPANGRQCYILYWLCAYTKWSLQIHIIPGKTLQVVNSNIITVSLQRMGQFANQNTNFEIDCNRPMSQIPQCIWQIYHHAQFCHRNVHTCSHFCYKMVHCGIWDWCIVRFVGEWVIKFNGLSGDSGHRGPYSPYKLCNHSLYIGIMIFPHMVRFVEYVYYQMIFRNKHCKYSNYTQTRAPYHTSNSILIAVSRPA